MTNILVDIDIGQSKTFNFLRREEIREEIISFQLLFLSDLTKLMSVKIEKNRDTGR